jgi:outer membrane lipoprotein
MKTLVIVSLIAACSACASKPASLISLAVVDDVSLAQVRADSSAYQGSTVRWGGVITEVENKADTTWVFLVGRELRNNEKPITDSLSDGRFVARFNGFIDPLVYKLGRPLTVVGRIDGSLQRAIGEFEYRFPIVAVRDSHLWAEAVKIRPYYYPPPWWYRNYYYHPYPYPYPDW